MGVSIGFGLGVRYTGAREGLPLSSPIREETEGWPGQRACLTAQNRDNTAGSMEAEWAATGPAGVKQHGMRVQFTAFEGLHFVYRHMCHLLDPMHIIKNIGALLRSSMRGTWNIITLPN